LRVFGPVVSVIAIER